MIIQLNEMSLSPMEEEPQPEPAIHLPPVPNLPTMCTLFTNPPRQIPIITPEASPAELEVPPTLRILLTVPLGKYQHADFMILSVDTTATRQLNNLPDR